MITAETLPISITDNGNSAIRFTSQIRNADRPLIIKPNIPASVGSNSDRMILKYPTTKINATTGKTTTVQRKLNGVIV